MFRTHKTTRFTERTGLTLVSIYTIGDGNCLIHAILGAVSPEYQQADRDGKIAMAIDFRKRWFEYIIAHWAELDDLVKAAMDTLVYTDSHDQLQPNTTAMLNYTTWLYVGAVEPLLSRHSHIRINWATWRPGTTEEIIFPMASPDSYHHNIYIINTGDHFETLAVSDGARLHTQVHGNTTVHRELMTMHYS